MRGLTLIEIAIALALAGLIAAGAVLAFANFRSENSLSAAADFLKVTLEKSRISTLAKESGSGYSVKINENNLVWFKGQNFNEADSNNQLLILPSGIMVKNVNLENAGSIVTFNALTGTTSPGSIILAVSADLSKTITVYMNRSGLVSFASASEYELSKPITDSRHAHFNLGWSIQNATELKLRFLTNPIDTRFIPMTTYFNADKTNWDYLGAFTVGGQAQKIRMHTHDLNSAGTLLSIERSLMENSQPVEIYIDNKLIAMYAIDGSVTAGAFGGEMMMP